MSANHEPPCKSARRIHPPWLTTLGSTNAPLAAGTAGCPRLNPGPSSASSRTVPASQPPAVCPQPVTLCGLQSCPRLTTQRSGACVRRGDEEEGVCMGDAEREHTDGGEEDRV